MTLALVENEKVTQVGLPDKLRDSSKESLSKQGWVKIIGHPMPSEKTAPGYHWTYGESWSVENGVVYGEWSETQRPQPYPSWSWVDGEGWVPPVPQPDGDYYWDENSQSWVEEALA
jgi:hypothetical protein